MINKKIQQIGINFKFSKGFALVSRKYCSVEKYHATCFPGLEHHLKEELKQIKEIHSIQETTAGVSFQTTAEYAYEINLKSRVALRILHHITEGPLDVSIRGGDAVYEFTKTKVDWLKYYNTNNEGYVSVNARLHECDDINSSHLIEKRVRDAICDQIKDKTGTRPRPPFRNYKDDGKEENSSSRDEFNQNNKGNNEEKDYFIDLPVFVIAFDNKFSIFRDMSGESLHHRFYKRGVIHKASLNETWAAGILYEASWPDKVKKTWIKFILNGPYVWVWHLFDGGTLNGL
jgi:23S rRNA G2445 N2-methylase RlmL